VRDAFTKMLDLSGTLYTTTYAASASGQSPSTASSVVACRLTAPGGSAQEVEFAGRFVGRTMWRVLLPYGTAVKVGDRLTVGGPGSGLRQIEIVGDLGGRSFEMARIVMGVEIG
jgi:hypothetical protein